MKKILLFVVLVGFSCAANAQDDAHLSQNMKDSIASIQKEMELFKKDPAAILALMQSESDKGDLNSVKKHFNAMKIYHPNSDYLLSAEELVDKAEKFADAKERESLSPVAGGNSLPVNNTFPYGKMLNLTTEELEAKKFKYSDQYNRWVLVYSNGANTFLSVMQALNGESADIQPHPDDYSVTIQRGDNAVAYVSVVFYKDGTYHDILTFINDNGTEILETNSGNIMKTQFNYGGYAFALEMKKIGKTTVTRKTSAAAKHIDNSFNSYNFTIYTGVPATSPYLTKQAEKEARRESKGRKENNVNDLMF